MIQRIQALPQWQRIMVFIGLALLAAAAVLGLTLAVAWYSINGTPRLTPVAIREDVTVHEFATLPGDDAYPAALALAADGTLYTGSYTTGVIWRISPDGLPTELLQTRDLFGSITGLTVLSDGTLIVLDRRDPLLAQGALLWRVQPDTAPEQWGEIPASANLIPYEVARDANDMVYVTVINIGVADDVIRFAPDGTATVWWSGPSAARLTGLAYDAARAAMLVVDNLGNSIYAIPTNAADPQAEATVLYSYTATALLPGFDGLTAAPDGTLYLAALGVNRVARLNAEAGDLVYLAGAFRGSSRVAYDPARQRLYVNNADQRSLLPERLLFVDIDVLPRLPFTIDMVEGVTD